MEIPNQEAPVVGSQRARQGQNVKGMGKVLIWGTLLTAIGFMLLLALFGGMESDDANPAAATPTQPPVTDSPS